MIDKLKPYPAYNDSGVEWVVEVPVRWDVLPNLTFFNEFRKRENLEEAEPLDELEEDTESEKAADDFDETSEETEA